MRVHELAKELGLKSNDLIEFIKREALDVKPSTFAGIDPDMVDHIKSLFEQRGRAGAGGDQGRAKSQPTSPAPVRSKETARAVLTSTTPAERTESDRAAGSEAASESRAESVAAAKAGSPREVETARSDGAGRAGGGGAATRPSLGALGTPQPARPVVTRESGAGAAGQAGGAPSGASGSPPADRQSGGPLSAFRSGGGGRGAGPLAGHTPHRGSYSAESRSGSESGGGAASGPMKRSDYISPYGTRPTSQPGRPPSVGQPAPPRRTQEGNPPEARREGTGAGSGPAQRSGRPLPPVASIPASTVPARRADAPRPQAPQTPTQRPDQKFTAEQFKEMLARGGQLGAKGPVLPGRPGAPGRVPPEPGKVPFGPADRGAPPADDEDDKGKAGHSRLGSAADRAGRRAERSKRAIERKSISSPMPVSALMDDDESSRRSRGPRRSGKGRRTAVIAPRKTEAVLEPPITVRSLSEAIGVKGNDLIRKLMNLRNELVTINATLDEETALELAMEFGVMVSIHHERTAEDELWESFDATRDEGALVPRPPVVTVLGHVDHGKTSLLDRIRSANVVASESGGITQHIGAYQIEHNGHKITFVDTPGHEAFTAMRARGANVTDIVVLVVAADDGMMPQTIEAVAHAKAAEVPVVVALSKIDLPNVDTTANINKIYGELAQQGLNPQEWGGDTEVVKTSVVTGAGIDDLLLVLEFIAEGRQLKADPTRQAVGTCLEASISEGRGVVATVLVQDGTLRVGDVVVCGDGFGRVRAMYNDRGEPLTEAGPSTPVELSGLDSVPTAGERFAVVDDISRAREIAQTRRDRGRGSAASERQALTLENIYTKMSEQKVKSLNLILKADVQGSIEAITKELEKLKNDEVPIRILHKAVGGISESDVSLAEASDAIVIGFRVALEDRAVSLADEKKIDVRRYDIIYQVTDEIKKAVEGLLVPEVKEVALGTANVRQVFKISKVGTVAGCYVTRGTVERGAKARVFRDGVEVYKGSIEVLKRFKDDVKEVREGYDCGVKISNFDDIKVGDNIEAFRVDVIRRTL